MAAQSFSVEHIPLASLTPAPYNPRRIKRSNLAALTRELRDFGLVEPIVANRRKGGQLVVVGGHQRLEAAKLIGWTTVPVHVIAVSEARERALNLALNNPTLQGEWDEDLLRVLLTEIPLMDAALAGFDEAAVARIVQAPVEDDEAPPLPRKARTKAGEAIALGPHRLFCGDSRQAQSYAAAFGELQKATCMWTDPPYGVGYVGKTKRALTIEGDTDRETENLLACAFGHANNSLVPGAALYVCRPAGGRALTFIRAFQSVPWSLRQELAWRKDTMVLGHADYHYQHEPILYGRTPGNGRMGRGGNGWHGGHDQTSVQDVPRPKSSQDHPTMKPPALIEIHLRNSTRRGDVVLDPFAGSGSTMVAAHRLGRRCVMIEIDPSYCDVIRDRFEAIAGERRAGRG